MPTSDETLEKLLETVPTYPKENGARYREGFKHMARGGIDENFLSLHCFVDYIASEYILGAGNTGNKLTVVYGTLIDADSCELYRQSQDDGFIPREILPSEPEYMEQMAEAASTWEGVLRESVEGREGVLFLAPMAAQEQSVEFECKRRR